MAQLAAARQGTHSTKSRGEVAGGGKKPYRQKGTGRARQGSIRAPQYNGGGIVHGPTPRYYDQRTPKKMKAAALRGALSDRARTVACTWSTASSPATRRRPSGPGHAARAHRRVPACCVVVDREDTITALEPAQRRRRRVILTFDQLNTYDVLLERRRRLHPGRVRRLRRGAFGRGRQDDHAEQGGDRGRRPRRQAGRQEGPGQEGAGQEGSGHRGRRRRGEAGQEGHRQEGACEGCRRGAGQEGQHRQEGAGQEGRCRRGTGQEGCCQEGPRGQEGAGQEDRCQEGCTRRR